MGIVMGRSWNISEQVVEDPTTKLRLEFTSVHSEAVLEGQPAPDHDQIIYLRVWTTDRTRVATYAFTRAGDFIKTAIEHVDPGQGTVAEAVDDGMRAADPGLEAAQQARLTGSWPGESAPAFAPRDSGPGQTMEEAGPFGDVNYADQFVGDI